MASLINESTLVLQVFESSECGASGRQLYWILCTFCQISPLCPVVDSNGIYLSTVLKYISRGFVLYLSIRFLWYLLLLLTFPRQIFLLLLEVISRKAEKYSLLSGLLFFFF